MPTRAARMSPQRRRSRIFPLVTLLMAGAPSAGAAAVVRQLRTEPTTREAIAQVETRGYFRYPAIRGSTIVFTAEGDLWRVGTTGGDAVRLTTHPEVEARSAISPDGRWLAYTAAYEGPREVYVMPIDGGPAVRQTWEGGSADVVGWMPDGRLLYATRKYSALPVTRLVAIRPCTEAAPGVRMSGPVCSPDRERIPLAGAASASIAPDGTMYFTRWPAQGSYTKRYVGGTAESIWKWSPGPATGREPPGESRSGPEAGTGRAAAALPEAVPLTADYPGTSTSPMYWNGRVWFLSDRAKPGTAHSLAAHRVRDWDAGVMNIWSMAPDGSDVRQHTFHADYDVATPSLDQGRIVYQQGADVWILDLSSGETAAPRRLEIRLPSDFDQMRENWVERPMDFLTSAHVSPTGDRVALTSRGRVFVAPAGSGRFVEADRAQGVRYREAIFMPDGRDVLALSDETGEVELWTLPASGIGDRAQLTKDARILRWQGIPSPDGQYIAHNDKNQDLWLYDTRAKSDRRIRHNDRESAWISSAPGFSDLAWSPDGRWLVYNDVASNFLGRLVLYDTRDDSHHPLTSDRYDSWGAVFSPDGQWLWFLSDRTFRTSVGSPWGPRQPDPYYDRRTNIYGLALKADAPWPFRPLDELSPDSTDRTPGGRGSPRVGGDAAARGAAPAPIEIDLDGIESRLYEVPVPAGDIGALATDGRRLYWIGTQEFPARRNLMSMEITRRSVEPSPVMEDVASYELSLDRRRLMVRKGRDIYVFDAAARAPQNLADSRVDLSAWAFSVDPRDEWRNNFADAWRLERDYFYDPGMNGVDWPAMREKYAPLAARVTDRSELNDVLAQMVGELSALHIFVRGGDVRDGPDDVSIGSLGAILDRDLAAGGWQVSHIFRSDPDVPSDLAPLARPDIGVREGDVITAIDGTPTLAVPDPNVLLRNKAGRQVRLTVVRPGAGGGRSNPPGRGVSPPQIRSVEATGSAMARRDIILEPISAARENSLRYTDWEYSRRLAVDSLGGGRIGYVHLRAMGGGNMTEWVREYYPVFNREGLIIDVRHNTGGNIDSWLLGKLLRRDWFWWKPRVGEPYADMPYSFRGPIVVLVDEATASDGEAFAEGFRRLGLGKVIGVRTWGGEIWLSSNNFLADRGIATAAEQGVYADGEWLIEGWGVEPDIVVDNLPVRSFAGGDAQLEAAVRDLLDQLGRSPVVTPPVPAYPRKRIGGEPD